MVGGGVCGQAQISVIMPQVHGPMLLLLAVTSTYESMRGWMGGCLFCRKVRGIRISCNLMPPIVDIVRHLR